MSNLNLDDEMKIFTMDERAGSFSSRNIGMLMRHGLNVSFQLDVFFRR
jgi:hypothetical protein